MRVSQCKRLGVVCGFWRSLWTCDQLCVDHQGVSCWLLFSSARLASCRGGFGKQPKHLAGVDQQDVEAAAECGASVQPVIRVKTKMQSSLDVLTANVTKIVVARMPQRPPFCGVSFPPPLRAGPLGR